MSAELPFDPGCCTGAGKELGPAGMPRYEELIQICIRRCMKENLITEVEEGKEPITNCLAYCTAEIKYRYWVALHSCGPSRRSAAFPFLQSLCLKSFDRRQSGGCRQAALPGSLAGRQWSKKILFIRLQS
jgi:hypothetical protein